MVNIATRLCAILAFLTVFVSCSGFDQPVDKNTTLTIAWDEWGVPHIRAANIQQASYGLGWAQMRGRPNLVLKLMAQGRGRAAEALGADYLASDQQMWALGIPQRLDSLYQAQGEQYGQALSAFAKAINDYAAAHPEKISEDVARVLPVDARDVLGHISRVIHLKFVALKELPELTAANTASSVNTLDAEATPGSNAWAVGPKKSASGEAMLLANPHLFWSDLYYFFESHIQTPKQNSYGVSLIGQPFQAIAFNEFLGWTHTVNTYDGADIYRFKLQKDGYIGLTGLEAFSLETVQLRVRNKVGDLEDHEMVIKRTDIGPVLKETADTAYAIKIAGLEVANSQLSKQYWQMAQATNLKEFEQAMAQLQMPMFNTLYADRTGNIFYLFNGLMPQRLTGDHRLWAGHLDGSNASHRWQQYLPYQQLPKYANPPGGFIQNANEPPWTSTIPAVLKPSDYPADFVSPQLRERPQLSLDLLLRDNSISFEEFIAYSQTTRLMQAENIVDDLVILAKKSDKPVLVEAAKVLANWDRSMNINSRGAVLFYAWHQGMGSTQGQLYKNPWRFDQPDTAPSGLANPSLALQVLEQAAQKTLQQYGRLDAPWGELARIKREGLDLPVAAAPKLMGAFRVGWLGAAKDGSTELVGGTTYVAAIRFGKQPKARGLLPYGNFAKRPEGVRSQWQVFADGKLRPIYFSDSDIEKNAVMNEVLKP